MGVTGQNAVFARQAQRGASLCHQWRDARRTFLQVREQSYDSDAVVGFLRVLLCKLRGKILLIWDGSPIHRGQPIKDFLRRGAARRLHLE
jgi:hypothetical protein